MAFGKAGTLGEAIVPIAWDAFSWEAFSTLSAGVAAVLGAIVVGIKQAKISSQQTEILKRQIQLEELSFRASLFERRMKIYESTSEFLLSIIRNASPPDGDREISFLRAQRDTEFLFAPNVLDHLNEIWRRAAEYRAIYTTARHTFETKGHYGAGNPEREAAAVEWFAERLRILPSLFGEELRLGRPGEGS
jgi:F0F1-type ATP synthase membrane subunit c/vacuolar-type H+-ATPase subunit K